MRKHGGAGTDTASYVGSSAGVTVLLYTDSASGGDAQGDELNQIENLSGSSHADTFWGTDGVNVLRGYDGNDTLKGFGGADTLWGGDGADALYGMDGVDTLHGEDGSDYLDGGEGADTMNGALGNDMFIVDNVNDVVTDGSFQGNDVVRASTSWTMLAGVWVETLETTDADGTDAINLTGNGILNTINGNDGANVINGGSNADTMTGFGGDDTYIVDNESDVIVEAAADGNDQVYSTAGLRVVRQHRNVVAQRRHRQLGDRQCPGQRDLRQRRRQLPQRRLRCRPALGPRRQRHLRLPGRPGSGRQRLRVQWQRRCRWRRFCTSPAMAPWRPAPPSCSRPRPTG